MFSILDPVRARVVVDPFEILTDWKRFQSIASDLISPSIDIHSSEEAHAATRGFAASITSAYSLSARKNGILGRKYEQPGLDRPLKHKKKLRKQWQETRDPACRTAVNWVTKTIRRMNRKRALEGLETKIANCEAARYPQAILLIAKSLTEGGGPKATSATHCP
jgi:hypothetical protein